MKVTKSFVKYYLIILIVFIVFSAVMLTIGLYSKWMGIVLTIFLLGILFLILNKYVLNKLVKIGWFKQKKTRFTTEKSVGYKIAYALTYLIPLIILLYVIYMNVLPFGYEKTFVLDVGAMDDTDGSNELYLVESDALGPRTCIEGNCFRELNGVAELVFNPKAVIKNATINISIEGDIVYIVPKKIDFNPDDYEWDLDIDFSEGIPDYFEGNVSANEEGIYFNDSQRLIYPGTKNSFENESFTVHVEWVPKNNNSNFQQIVGHYNWELLQGKDDVRFTIGRMNNASGPFYSIFFPIESDFFNKNHSALVVYNSDNDGQIMLFIDGILAEIKSLNGDKIWVDYGQHDLSFGKSKHGVAEFMSGNVNSFSYASQDFLHYESNLSILFSEQETNFNFLGEGAINKVIIEVK